MKKIFNEEEEKFVLKNIPHYTTGELAEIVNKKFNKNVTSRQITDYKRHRNLKGGKLTTFKKGRIPHNCRKIGEEVVRYSNSKFRESETYIKVSKDKWMEKRRYLYSQFDRTPNSKEVIVFLDGDKTNFKEENLSLVSKEEFVIARGCEWLFNNAELTKTGLLLTKLKLKTREKEVE